MTVWQYAERGEMLWLVQTATGEMTAHACQTHGRLLSYAEAQQGACSWCQTAAAQESFMESAA